MKSLTLVFYAVATFFLGVMALSAIAIDFPSSYGATQAQVIKGITGVLTVIVPLAFLAAIPFVGTRRGD